MRFLFYICVSLLMANVRAIEECGKVRNAESFPWNVGIYIQQQNKLELICFGTLFKSNAILTAAHCFCDNISGVLRDNTFYIILNNLKQNFNLDTDGKIMLTKDDIVLNKLFKGLNNLLMDDIAIVKLKDKIRFNEKVSPVCIDWSSIINDNGIGVKQPIWSATKVVNLDRTDLSPDDCSLDAPNNFRPFVTPEKYCLKTEGVKLVQADGGAGLVILNPSDGLWYLKGVISTHESMQGQMSTYTRVNEYLNWISNISANLARH